MRVRTLILVATVGLAGCSSGGGGGGRSSPEGSFKNSSGYTAEIASSTFKLTHTATSSDSRAFTIEGSSSFTLDSPARNGESNWSCGDLVIMVTKVVLDGNVNGEVHGAKAGRTLNGTWAQSSTNGLERFHISLEGNRSSCTGVRGLVVEFTN